MTDATDKHILLNFLRTCWIAVGTLSLYLSLSFFCLSQQWPVKLPNAIVEKGDATPHGAALYGPTPPLLDGGDDRWLEWSCAQGLLLFCFQIFPALLLVYFLVRFITGTAIVRGVPISEWHHFFPPVSWSEGIGKYAPSCKLAPDYIRFWEPWFFLLLVITGIILLGSHLVRTFEKAR
jgi:hypothetical protein